MSTSPLSRRVVVTGTGVLLPWGNDAAALARWPAPAPARIADFQPRAYISQAKALRAMHRGFQLTAAAVSLALREAGFDNAGVAAAGVAPERAGTAVAAADFTPATPDLLTLLAQIPAGPPDWPAFGEAGLHGLHPFRRLGLLTNMAAAHVAILFGLQGPSLTLTSGAMAGRQAVEECCWLIAEDRADLMVCEAADCPELALARGAGEAAAALVLEEREHALARGARLLAEMQPAPACPPTESESGAYPNAKPLLDLLRQLVGGGGAATANWRLRPEAGAAVTR